MDLLRHLSYFTAVAEHRHFGDAAASLGITQPPLSQGIRRLELRWGVRLFDRNARHVRITEVGAALLLGAEEVLRHAAELQDLAGIWTSPCRVRLGLAGDLEGLVAEIVGALVSGGLQVDPVIAGTVDLIERLKDGELDAVVICHPSVVDGVRAGPVSVLPTRLVGTVCGSGPIPLRALQLPLVVTPRRHHPSVHDQLVDVLRRYGHDGTVIEATSSLERDALVAAGHGVRLTLDTTAGRPIHDEPLPIRVRVVLPVESDRRPEIDYDEVLRVVQEELSR